MDRVRHGFTDLHRMSRAGDIAAIKDILRDDPSTIDILDMFGRTALHEAALIGGAKIVEYLLRLGADPNIQDKKGYTPLHFAVQENHIGAAKALLRNSANPNLKDSYGNTPLLRSILKSKGRPMTNLLVSYKANPNIKNAVGNSARSLAKKFGRLEWLKGTLPFA
jgi:ankyrin repeat protein